MQTVLFIAIHRPNRSPSQRYRFEQYIPYLQSKGWVCEQFYLISKWDDRFYYAQGKALIKAFIAIKVTCKLLVRLYFGRRTDVCFIQREAYMMGTSFFEKQFTKRSKLIYDFDDSIWMNTVSKSNRVFSFLKNAKKVNRIIRFSDQVIVGNSYLADYARQFNENVRVIPSTIDTAVYTSKDIANDSVIVIGWSGSFSTIEHFKTIEPVLFKLKQHYGSQVRFMVIGDESYFNPNLNISGVAWNADSEVSDLHKMDIGIMPLPDDEWTRGKCAMKGLQYMGAGIPTVMSPVGVNSQVIQDGENGFLASTDEEWFLKLSALIDSIELRKKMAAMGRETIEKNFSVKANASLYLETLNGLVNAS